MSEKLKKRIVTAQERFVKKKFGKKMPNIRVQYSFNSYRFASGAVVVETKILVPYVSAHEFSPLMQQTLLSFSAEGAPVKHLLME